QTTRQVEFYLAGNVEIREKTGTDNRLLRADEVYYDVSRNVAVALNADLEFKPRGNIPDPIHMKADELLQLSPTQFQVVRAEVFSSKLPSDPGLKLVVTQATLDEKQIPKRSLFGQPIVNRETGKTETEQQLLFHGDNAFVKIDDVPVFYLPFV